MAKKATAGYGVIGVDSATVRGEIFSLVRLAGARGVTCDEVENRLYLPHQTASARISELVASRVIVQTGEKRPTSTGRKARVYRVSSSTNVFDAAPARPVANVPAHASQAW
jgi:hypothetical protein